MTKQLIIISDMEGASGIFDDDKEQFMYGGQQWRELGRDNMTSDILAVCEAANEYGIDEILYCDAHFAENPGFNTILEKLPDNVKVCSKEGKLYWRKIREYSREKPFGIITVGQHARNGEPNGYHAHTIQSPPIKAFWLNGLHIAKIGTAVLSFQNTKYIANVGCEASKKEARELSSKVKHISVKDKAKNWEPSKEETYPIIKQGILDALINVNNFEEVSIKPPFNFKLELCKYFYFDKIKVFSWQGEFHNQYANWQAPSIAVGLEIFNTVRENIKINDEDFSRIKEEILNGVYNKF